MKHPISNTASILLIIFLTLNLMSCKQEDSILLSDSFTESDKEALEKLVEEDESLQSFDLNYDEEEAMSFILNKTAAEIYPVKIGQRMKLVSRNMEIIFEEDKAFGTLVLTFEGVLFIVASSVPNDGSIGDLDLDVYEKPFTTTIIRNLIFEKIRNTDIPRKNWKLTATSLPVGGTLTENISIEKLTIHLPNGETLIIDSPLDYYLSRGPSFDRLVPELAIHESVGIEVQIKSTYEQADFVTLTYGALRDRKSIRAKKRFVFDETSEIYDEVSGFYHRTYKGDWIVNQFRGYKHAIINAFPWGVIKDSEQPVETNSWGIPYIVK